MLVAPAPRYRPLLWFAALLLLLLAAERCVVRLPQFPTHPLLPAAVTLDVLAGVPLLYYLLVVRRYQLPLPSVIGAFAGALALAHWLLPIGQQQYLGWAGQALVGLEAVLLIVAIINLRRLVHVYREAARTSADVVDNLHAAFQTVLGRAAAPLVSELSTVYYALLSWRARPEVQPGQTAFSAHRDSGFPALIGTVAALSLIETTAVHLLVSRWQPTAALVLLVLDVYTLLFLLGHGRAVVLRPVVVDGAAGQLNVRVGAIWQVRVPLAAVVGATELRETPSDKRTRNLAKVLLTEPNVALTFAEPVTVTGPYGLRHTARRVLLYVDDRAAFLRRLHLAADGSSGQNA